MPLKIEHQEISSLEEIKNFSKHRLTFVFAGVGSAFSKKNYQTSLIVAKNGVLLLVDIGTTIPTALSKKNIKLTDFDYYYLTHSHADHIGGVEELLLTSRYLLQRKPQIIITEVYQDLLWENSLKGGCGHNENEPLNFSDLAQILRPIWIKSHPRAIYQINIADIHLTIYRTIHIPGNTQEWSNLFWSTGILVDNKVVFTADTQFDPTLFEDINVSQIETIFHDCQLFNPGTVHATYQQLKTLPFALRNKILLTHYGDNFEQYDPDADGFRGFTKPWICYSW